MRRILADLMCSVLAFLMWAPSAYCNDVRFEQINSRSLPSNFVKYLYQDSEGLVWIATNNGLARYDGRHTVSYSSHLKDYSFIYEILEDAPGSLLLATDSGLVSLDKVSMKISVLVNDFSITTIIRDSKGNIWAGGADGLLCRPAGQDDFINIDLKTEDRSVVGVIDLIEDNEGRILMTTWHKGLYVYDPVEGSTALFREGELAYSYVLHRDSQGTIWVGTWGEGLLMLEKDFVSTSEYKVFSLLDDVIYVINDCGNSIYAGGQKGLSVMDRTTGRFSSFSVDNGLPYNQVNTILVTANNNIYLGLYGGGMCSVKTSGHPYVMDELSCIKNKFSTNTINSIYADDDGKLWMGVPDHGFIFYDPSAHSVFKYNELPALKDLHIISTAIVIGKRNLTGEICVGTFNEGFLLYDPDMEKTRLYSTATCDAIRSNNINAFENDAEGNLWIGTGQGLYILDTQDRLMSMNDYIVSASQESADDNVTDILYAQEDKIFFATSDRGVGEIDVKSGTVRYNVPEGNAAIPFHNLLLDADGRLWAGSVNNGLYRLDADRNRLVSRNPIRELSNQSIANLLTVDDAIWLTTDNDLVSFRDTSDVNDPEVFCYVSDMDVNFSSSASLLIEDTLVFGATEGVFNLALEDIRMQPHLNSQMIMTDFIVNGKSYRELDDSGEDINYVSEINVKKGDNVEIRYTLADYNDYQTPLYRCTCNGVSWITAEDALSFEVSSAKTVVQISHPASGQSKTIVIIARSYWQYLIIVLMVVVIFLTYRIYSLKTRRSDPKEPEAKAEHDVIAFEITSAKVASTDQEVLEKAMDVISRHISDSDFNQSAFIHEMGISRTLLTEKIKKLTGFTPNALILEIRLKTAYNTIMSAQDKLRISDVAYSVGFNDAKYFGTCFRKKYGMTPKELMTQRLESLSNSHMGGAEV